MAVSFRCKRCGAIHQAPLAFKSREAFEAAPALTRLRCPIGGPTADYNKLEMTWSTDAPTG